MLVRPAALGLQQVLLLGQQTGPADRDAGLVGRGGEDPEVFLGESGRTIALDHQDAHGAAVDEERHVDLGPAVQTRDIQRFPGDIGRVLQAAGVEHPAGKPGLGRHPPAFGKARPAHRRAHDPFAGPLIDQEEPHEVVADVLVLQALHDGVTDGLLVRRRGDRGAEAKEGSLAPGGVGAAGAPARGHGFPIGWSGSS